MVCAFGVSGLGLGVTCIRAGSHRRPRVQLRCRGSGGRWTVQGQDENGDKACKGNAMQHSFKGKSETWWLPAYGG